MRIFTKLKGMVSPGTTRFEIAKHGVDLAELGNIPRRAAICDDHRMHPSRIGYAVEARKAIREDLTFGIQSGAPPVFYGGTGESFNACQSCVDGMPLLIHRDGRDKRYFVFGASSRFATGSFLAQIGVISLYGALQRIERFAFQHGLHELIMESPGCGVANAALATQRQRGQPRLRLADQVNGQKPEGHRQTSPLKEDPANQRSLVAAMAALKCLARAAFQNRMPGSVTTLGAMKSVWPMRRFQGCSTLLLGIKTPHKIGERQSVLKVHAVHRHGTHHCHKNQWMISGEIAA